MIEAYIQDHQLNAMRIAGRPRGAGRSDDRTITVYNPYKLRNDIAAIGKPSIRPSVIVITSCYFHCTKNYRKVTKIPFSKKWNWLLILPQKMIISSR